MAPIIIYSKPQIFVPVEAFDAQTFSVSFNGTDEFMRNDTAQVLGFADEWSLSVWADLNGGANQRLLGWRDGITNVNAILLARLDATDDLQAIVFNSAGGATTLVWNSVFTAGAWHHIFLFRESDGTIRAFIDGADLGVPDSGNPDGVATMADTTNRHVWIGADQSSLPVDGEISQVAVWDADISAAISDIYNGGNPNSLNLNGSFGSYSFAGNLAHWWRLGHGADPDIGKDYAEAGITPTIDVGTDAANIDDTDRVANVPS